MRNGAPLNAPATTIKALGNAGFQVLHGPIQVLFDPFILDAPLAPSPGTAQTLILITHDHWDHFSPRRVAEAAGRPDTTIVGPQAVVKRLAREGVHSALLALEPEALGASLSVQAGRARVVAIRTRHARVHVSYLVETDGLRVFHDGDNEDTRSIDRGMLRNLDALMLCPWQGSDWVGFLDHVRPARWFLMHLSDEELDDHERGAFFTDLCDHVPEGLVVLRPGQAFELPERSSA